VRRKEYFQKLPRSYRDFVIVLAVAGLAICLFVLSIAMNSTTNVSAVEVSGVGVYWDRDCSDIVSSIEWGTLQPGSAKNVAVYIRNEEEKPMYLIVSTTKWNPPKASQYLNLGWDYSEQRMNPGEILRITLTLSVSRYIEGISSFSFDILISGSDHILGDINGDGIVDVFDFIIVAAAFGSKPGDSKWNPDADLNSDGLIDIFDVEAVAKNFGKTEP